MHYEENGKSTNGIELSCEGLVKCLNLQLNKPVHLRNRPLIQVASIFTSFYFSESLYPGSYEELHRKARDVFPTCFEGAKVMVSKGLSSHFQVSHTLSISPANTGYRFGATYVGSKVVGPQEQYPIFLGDTDVAGNTTATVLHQFGTRLSSYLSHHIRFRKSRLGDNYRLRLQGQVQQNKLVGAQGTFERRGRLTTLGLTLANTDLVNESGVLVGQMLRKLTERLDVGAEFLYQYGKQIPGGVFIKIPCAVGTIAYQAELPDEGVTMRASIDTNWSVGGVFEKRLSQQLPFTLALSGLFNHSKVAGKFGVGLIIG
ncbi:eukaryotic porin [Necator americanus]|uniref:Eukaryotic porin n=1 Tax=Necator americanus TaxID=51031 RepID=W2T9L3_NECAM|nr:eukaryotic porin [Necator americanus]ETN78259.1 eukaryotic porin [Necator americanus]